MSIDQDFMKEMQKEYLDEVSYLLEQCEESYLKLERPEHRSDELDKIFRFAHSLKGTGTTVGFHDLASFAHAVEDLLSVLRLNPEFVTRDIISLLLMTGDAFKKRINSLKQGVEGEWDVSILKEEVLKSTEELTLEYKANVAQQQPQDQEQRKSNQKSTTQSNGNSSSLIKIDPSKIEGVLDLVGELVVIKGQLMQSIQCESQKDMEILSLLDKTVRELQDKTLFMRLTAIKPLFLKVQRVIRDLAIQQGKHIDFQMLGEEIEIDRTMIELLNDPFVHIARNAVDHGIESSEIRLTAGKAERATITMKSYHSSGRVIIEFVDDGNGIDKSKVIKRAMERGLLSESANLSSLSNAEVYNLLFMPGFSTREEVTDVSGRGVGLDVVKSAVEKLKGSIEIESSLGSGTTFRISVPLTTAIADGIIVSVEGHRFVLPMADILELNSINPGEIFQVSGESEAVFIRNRTIPLIKMNKVLTYANSQYEKSEESDPGESKPMMVIFDHYGSPVAMQVDQILGQNQVVVKALPSTFSKVFGLAGASILGDGRIALVLDLDALAKETKKNMPRLHLHSNRNLEEVR